MSYLAGPSWGTVYHVMDMYTPIKDSWRLLDQQDTFNEVLVDIAAANLITNDLGTSWVGASTTALTKANFPS